MANIIAQNKKARFNYDIIEEIESGIVLSGGEVKSIKKGNINLKESFVKSIDNSLFLVNANVCKWKGDTSLNYDSNRSRKLLIKKKEFISLLDKVSQKGYTLVPLNVYTKGSLIKIKIGLGKGRKIAGKKKIIRERDLKVDMKRDLKKIIKL